MSSHFTDAPVIQIAGIRNRQEAYLLMRCGVDWLGFPLRLPVHREDIEDKQAARIMRKIKAPHQSVLITYLDTAKEIEQLCHKLAPDLVQLHGTISSSELNALKQRLPQLRIVKSLIVRPGNQAALKQQIRDFHPLVDYFITDSYDPQTGASGATGKSHDWQRSRELTELSPKPLILAGGLTPQNVYQAIHQVRPAGVDAHTGVEDTAGRKDPQKILQFVSRARKGFGEIYSPEAVTMPIDGVLDLHTFPPAEVKQLIPDYIQACLTKNIYQIRIIHGKGRGTLRTIVHQTLKRLPQVAHFRLAGQQAGGWGATLVELNHS